MENSELEEALLRADLGYFEPIQELAERSGSGAHRDLAGCFLHLAAPAQVERVSVEAMVSHADVAEPEVLAALPSLARLAMVEGNLLELRRADAAAALLQPEDGLGWLRAEVTMLWRCAAEGEAVPDARIEILVERARARKHATLLLEAEVVRSWLLSNRDWDEGVSVCRRASRMARSESAPQAEYMANLRLARIRRLSGRPHLAARILTALSEFAPPAYFGHLGWELILAGSLDAGMELAKQSRSPVADAAVALGEALNGNPQPLAEVPPEVKSLFGRDAGLVLGLLGAHSNPEAQSFATGEPSALPLHFRGLANIPAADASVRGLCEQLGGRALWLASPKSTKRMIPRASAGTEAPLLYPEDHKGSRVLTGLSVLAQAGETGVSTIEFFTEVYGLTFQGEKHRGILNVLLHRIRGLLGERGNVVRGDDERLRLQVLTPIRFVDPRCSPDNTERLLELIAAGPRSVADLAGEAGVSKRSIQRMLSRLMDDGACVQQRQGRAIRYVVEDTTFDEPTRR